MFQMQFIYILSVTHVEIDISSVLCRYSRRILWLEVGTTNSDPEIVAHYFLQCVKKLEGDNDYNIIVIYYVKCLLFHCRSAMYPENRSGAGALQISLAN